MGRLFLFDGTAVAYRSHFAMMRSGLSAPDGRPTGATYGFTMALRRILRDEAPDLVAVALDAIALAEISSSESSRANQAKAWLQYAKVLDAQGNTREAASIRSRYRRQRG